MYIDIKIQRKINFMNEKSVALNWVRIIACILVIGIHLLPWISELNRDNISLSYTFIEHFVRIGLPMFFALSALSFSAKQDILVNIKSYYFRKVVNVFLPFFVWSAIYFQISNNEIQSWNSFTIQGFLQGLYKSLYAKQYYHLWYMYALIGLVLLMPFLKRLIDNLTYHELTVLCTIILIVQALKEYLRFNINEFYFETWVSFYIIGAFTFRFETRKYLPILSAIGGVSYVVSTMIEYLSPNSVLNVRHWDYSPLMIFQVVGFIAGFLWIESVTKFPGRRISEKLSKLTYEVYLSHPLYFIVLKYMPVFNVYTGSYGIWIKFILVYLETVVVSFVVAALIELGISLSRKILLYIKSFRKS